ncbi:MAG TPA: carboxypeptidase-like regulatory domain-containing protein [Planctomycetota bacterium]|nr:carboxypeptidase-like regulatory domain-containing protein [Planctomycetota bacterium]
MMARRAWIFAVAGMVLVVLAVALHTASREAVSGARGGTALSSALPGEPHSLALPGADSPGAAVLAPSGDVADVQGETAVPPAPVGEAITFSGRVLDSQGQPLAGAEVLFVPCGRTLRALGRPLVRGSRLHGALPEDIVRVSTGADGRFELGSRLLHRKPGEPTDAGQPSQAVIVVRAEGLADFGHPCFDACTSSYDAGDLQLVAGASLEGRVVDEHDQPLAGARVAADVESEQDDLPPPDVSTWLHAVDSGADGRFVLPGLPTGAVRLHLAASGCTRLDTDPVSVQAGSLASCGDLVLRAGSLVAGTVVDPQGKPRANARVTSVWIALGGRDEPTEIEQALAQLRDACAEAVTLTDEDGHFELGGLSGGNLSLVASLDGYEAALVHEIAPGRRDVVLPLRARAELHVTVVDRASRALVGGTLEARRQAASWAMPGEYAPLDVLPVDGSPGRWRVLGAGAIGTELRFTAPGYARTNANAPGLPPGESLDWPLELDRGVDVTGHVSDAQGRPLGDAGLTLMRKSGQQPQSTDERARSDERGRFAFCNLPAGTYVVRGEACGCVSGLSETVTLEPGRQPPDLALVLQRAGAITGRLLDADGRPLSGRKVSAQGPPGEATSASRSSRTDTAGRFALRDLTPGTWDLAASPGALEHAVVEADAVTHVELHVARGSALHGTVVADGVGVPHAAIVAMSNGFPHHTLSDERGRYDLALDPGAWLLRVTTADGGLSTTDVTLAPGEVRTLDLPLPVGRLTVLAQSADGLPAVGTALNLDWLPAGATADESWKDVPCQLVTDAKGMLVYEHLPAGDYRVKALGEAWLDAEPVQLTLGDEPLALQLALQPAAVLHGRVLTSAGLPAPDQTVVQVYQSGGRHAYIGGATLSAGNGSFSVGRLESGSYLVAVRTDWGRAYDASAIRAKLAVDVTEGQTTEATLVLP